MRRAPSRRWYAVACPYTVMAAATIASILGGRQLSHTGQPSPAASGVPAWATGGGCSNSSLHFNSLEGEIRGSTDGTDADCVWTILPAGQGSLVAVDINTSESDFVAGDSLTFYALNAGGSLAVGTFGASNRLPPSLRLLRRGARELHGMSLRLSASSSTGRVGTSYFRMR